MSHTQANKLSSGWFTVKELCTKSLFNELATVHFYVSYFVFLQSGSKIRNS